MKKIAFFMMALAAIVLTLGFTACGNNPNEPNPGEQGNDSTQTGDGTIVYVNHEDNPIVVSAMGEKSLSIFGEGEYMIQNYSPDEETMIAIFEDGIGISTVADDYHDNILLINEGDLINGSAHWTFGSQADATFCTLYENSAFAQYTPWDAMTGYVGICQQQSDGTHFGWIKMTVVVNTAGEVTVTVYGWAYEKTANTPIKAGRKA